MSADTVASGQLRAFVERIERLRKIDAASRAEQETILELYKAALGMA